MKQNKFPWGVVGIGGFGVIYLALKIAPYTQYGLLRFFRSANRIFEDPLKITITENSLWMVLFLLAIYGVVIALIYDKDRKFRRGEEYGSASWGNVRATAEKYRDHKHPEANLILSEGMKIGTLPDMLYRHQRNLNVVVIGGSGAGKTRGYVMPNLLQASMSYVVLDPSGEILKACGNYLVGQGYTLKVLNLVDFDASDKYNPFVYLRSDEDVEKMVANFWMATTEKDAKKGEQIWDDMAKELLAALCFYLYYFAPKEEQNFPNIQAMVRKMSVSEQGKENDIDNKFEKIKERNPNHICLKHYQAYKSGAAKTLQSIQITLFARLGKFNLSSVERMSVTTEDSLGLFDTPKHKTVIFAVTPVADTSYNFFVSLLYTQLFDILYEYGNAHGHLEVPLHFLMDEFANVTLPADFEQRLATFRKYWISASIILQNISQIQALYEKQWKSIIGNADTLLYLGGNEYSTFELISKQLGKETIRTNTYGQTKGRQGSYSKNEQQLGRELMTPDEVGTLDNNYSIIFIRGEKPLLDQKYDLMKHPNIRATTYGGAKPYKHKPKPNNLVPFVFEPVTGLSEAEIAKLPEINLDTGFVIYPNNKKEKLK